MCTLQGLFFRTASLVGRPVQSLVPKNLVPLLLGLVILLVPLLLIWNLRRMLPLAGLCRFNFCITGEGGCRQ